MHIHTCKPFVLKLFCQLTVVGGNMQKAQLCTNKGSEEDCKYVNVDVRMV